MESRQTFFRQSGWMVFATLTSGVFMFAVHIFAPFMGDAEYGLFGTLLAMMNVMLIPALGLQTVFAHQTASARTAEDEEQLTATAQALLVWTFFLWSALALLAFIYRQDILSIFKISNPAALWVTLLIGLGQLWMPVLMGIMQGRQNFLWLGWAQIFNGAGRFVAVAIIVVLLSGKATGGICGALIGVTCAVMVGIIFSRPVWWRPRTATPFAWKEWLGRVVPLTLGLGASQFLFSVDVIYVRAIFGEHQTGYYTASGMLGRGLVMFSAPLIVVMFPKIVHNLAHGQKSNLLLYTLLGTLALSAVAAAGCTAVAMGIRLVVNSTAEYGFLPSALVTKIRVNPEGMLTLSQLIPWFVWCMIPLAAANVLLNNLMARKRFRVVPYLLVVIAGYAATLSAAGNSFVGVIQILGLFCLIFLGVLALFTWADKRASERAPLI